MNKFTKMIIYLDVLADKAFIPVVKLTFLIHLVGLILVAVIIFRRTLVWYGWL